jgi:hypothetical protein
MIINQILGIVWFVMCCFGLCRLIRNLPRTLNSLPKSFEFVFLLVGTIIFLLTLVGIAASVLLLLGATWARLVLGALAFLYVIAIILEFVVRMPPDKIEKIYLSVCIVTLVIVTGWAANIFHF